MSGLHFSTLDLSVDGQRVSLALQRRVGGGVPILNLHGFGSTKEDYADLALHPAFAGRDLIAYDAPGCGASTIEDPTGLSIPFLVKVAQAVCDALQLERIHLTGHSMGGLTALLFAHVERNRVASFFNIEGNVAPEDCFLSRQIVACVGQSDAKFMAGFIERVRARTEYSSALYAASLPLKVRPTTPRAIFTSMVDISDNQPIMDMFLRLACRQAFVYGEQNHHLSYLPELRAQGIDVIEIAHSAHFPMYSNPPALWAAFADFLARTER